MPSSKDLIGQTLGQYTIIEQIGAGGMATVFRGHQPSLNRNVALKILPPHIAERDGFTQRFEREAQAIGNLHHPNILPVYDFGEDKGYGYIAMRYVPNARTLGDLMKNPLPAQQIVELTRQIASALDYAHQAGIVHRDIKPSNVLMDGEWVLLSDFGLAKIVSSETQLTGTGASLGTPAYMSPEQAQGEAIDHRTDIYSLGIILFEMLTGQIPHKAETPLALVVKRINEPIPLPRSFNPDIPPAVETVLLKALAAKPADRFNSAGELIRALQAAFAGQMSLEEADQTISGATMPIPPVAPKIQGSRLPSTPISIPPPPQTQTRHAVELVLMTLLGTVGACGLGGIFLSFMPSANPDTTSIALAPGCFGLFFASLTSIGMIWFRNKHTSASAWLAMSIIAWFIGVNLLGWGGFALLSPGNQTFVQNFGASMAFCFVPGGILAILGLALYRYDRSQRAALLSTTQGISASANPVRDDKLKRAEEYRRHIIQLIQQKKSTHMAGQLALIPPKLEVWQAHLNQLATRLQEFEANPVIQRDLKEVPAAIARLQAKQAAEGNPQLRIQMAETLAGHQEHQRQLEALVELIRRTELEIDETLASIGAIYSQLQMLEFKEIDSSRAKRLSANIDEQAARLGDLVAAMDEVYLS